MTHTCSYTVVVSGNPGLTPEAALSYVSLSFWLDRSPYSHIATQPRDHEGLCRSPVVCLLGKIWPFGQLFLPPGQSWNREAKKDTNWSSKGHHGAHSVSVRPASLLTDASHAPVCAVIESSHSSRAQRTQRAKAGGHIPGSREKRAFLAVLPAPEDSGKPGAAP